jgi:phage-related protein
MILTALNNLIKHGTKMIMPIIADVTEAMTSAISCGVPVF